MTSDNVVMEANEAKAREILTQNAPDIDAALLLALRPYEPYGRAHKARALLWERRPIPQEVMIPALLSCMRAFDRGRNDLPHDAASILERVRPLPEDLAEALLVLLGDPRWEAASAAASVLSRHASERRFFEALWAHRDAKGDGMMHAVLTACEAQRDRQTIPWLEKLRTRRNMGRGWKERIDGAIAKVRDGR